MEDDVIVQIQEVGDLFEVAKVTTYRGYRKKSQEEVEIKISDMGAGAASLRYHVKVYPVGNPEKYATGNPAGSIKEALMMVHWYDLDN